MIGEVVFLMRMWIPESPRWLMIHGREAEGEAIVADIEQRFIDAGQHLEPVPESAAIRLRSRTHAHWRSAQCAVRDLSCSHWSGLVADGGASLLLQRDLLHLRACPHDFFPFPPGDVGWYILPFAAGNFLGPVVLGRLFDTLGRRQMISATYAISGLLLAGCRLLFSSATS